jgi:chromosome segregation ATPase
MSSSSKQSDDNQGSKKLHQNRAAVPVNLARAQSTASTPSNSKELLEEIKTLKALIYDKQKEKKELCMKIYAQDKELKKWSKVVDEMTASRETMMQERDAMIDDRKENGRKYKNMEERLKKYYKDKHDLKAEVLKLESQVNRLQDENKKWKQQDKSFKQDNVILQERMDAAEKRAEAADQSISDRLKLLDRENAALRNERDEAMAASDQRLEAMEQKSITELRTLSIVSKGRIKELLAAQKETKRATDREKKDLQARVLEWIAGRRELRN